MPLELTIHDCTLLVVFFTALEIVIDEVIYLIDLIVNFDKAPIYIGEFALHVLIELECGLILLVEALVYLSKTLIMLGKFLVYLVETLC